MSVSSCSEKLKPSVDKQSFCLTLNTVDLEEWERDIILDRIGMSKLNRIDGNDLSIIVNCD